MLAVLVFDRLTPTTPGLRVLKVESSNSFWLILYFVPPPRQSPTAGEDLRLTPGCRNSRSSTPWLARTGPYTSCRKSSSLKTRRSLIVEHRSHLSIRNWHPVNCKSTAYIIHT